MFASTIGSITILTFVFANAYDSPYIVDVLDIISNISTPETVAINFRSVQPTRGVFALTGSADIKIDIDTDRTKGELKVLYSSNGGTYFLTPFQLPPRSLTSILNGPNKAYFKTMRECCTGAAFSEPFVSPLDKRVIKCENCLYPSDNFPNPMQLGYYKLVLLVKDLPTVDVALTFVIKLELKS